MWFRKSKVSKRALKDLKNQLGKSRCYNRKEIKLLIGAASVDETTANLLIAGMVAKMKGLEPKLTGDISEFLIGQLQEPPMPEIKYDPAFG